jgi:hypothetical protein
VAVAAAVQHPELHLEILVVLVVEELLRVLEELELQDRDPMAGPELLLLMEVEVAVVPVVLVVVEQPDQLAQMEIVVLVVRVVLVFRFPVHLEIQHLLQATHQIHLHH